MEEKEQTLMSAPTEKGEEEYTIKMLTPWEMELNLLEDGLDNPKLEKDCQDAVMQREGEC